MKYVTGKGSTGICPNAGNAVFSGTTAFVFNEVVQTQSQQSYGKPIAYFGDSTKVRNTLVRWNITEMPDYDITFTAE